MAGRHCIKKKRVFSRVLGRNVMRCAEFSGTSGLGQLGPLPFDPEQLKDTAITAAVAVGGAVGARKAGDYLGKTLKIDPLTPEGYRSNWLRLIEVGLGVFGGFALGKYGKQPEMGMAVMIGPMVINGMELAGRFLAPPVEMAGVDMSGHYGGDPALGATIEQDQFPAAWAQKSPYMDQVQQQFPAWSM